MQRRTPGRTWLVDGSRLYRARADYARMMAFYDAELQRIEVPYQRQYVATRHGATFVITAGNPRHPMLMLWHGANANMTMWIPYINSFAKHYCVIAADTLGDAGKSAPVRLDKVRSHGYGEWAADVCSALGVQQAHCIGISQGAWLIMQLATVAPQRIRSASLISAAGFRPVRVGLVVRMLPALLFGSPEQAARRFVRMMSAPGTPISEEEVQIFALLMRFKAERGTPVMCDADIRCLTAPTQVLMAQYEQAFDPHVVLRRALALLPNVVAATLIPGASHGMIERRAEVIALLERFLADQSR